MSDLIRERTSLSASNKPEDRSQRPKADFYISDKNESIQEKFSKSGVLNSDDKTIASK